MFIYYPKYISIQFFECDIFKTFFYNYSLTFHKNLNNKISLVRNVIRHVIFSSSNYNCREFCKVKVNLLEIVKSQWKITHTRRDGQATSAHATSSYISAMLEPPGRGGRGVCRGEGGRSTPHGLPYMKWKTKINTMREENQRPRHEEKCVPCDMRGLLRFGAKTARACDAS